jgi:putative ABC transport system permease protein
VTAVVDDVPKSSHFKFTILVSFESMRQQVGPQMERWMGDFQNYTYILLYKDADYKRLEAKFPELIQKNIGELLAATKGKFELFLQPLNRIYLYSETLNEFPQKGDIRYIYIFSGIALLILTIACINFLNLSTARSAARSKEVGVKKVLGAKRSQILFQFLTESILFTCIALILAVAVISTLWPLINKYTGLDDSILWNNKLIFSVALSALILLIGTAAGVYPAFFFSSFRPEFVLKYLKIGRQGSHFRNGLVVVQFVISTILIVSTLIIMSQINYIQNKKLGFKKDNIVVVPFDYKASLRSIESLKSDLLVNPDILSVATTSGVPGQFSRQNLFMPEGFTPENAPLIHAINVDKDYLPSMKLELISGRNFSDKFPADKKNSIIINESAAKRFGWENPIGKRITELAREHPTKIVIGVIKDFHFLPLYFKIDPLIIENEETATDPSVHHYNRPINYFLVGIAPVDVKKSVDYIRSILENKNSPLPYESFFLDDDFNQIYKSEVQLSQIFSYFTGIAILLACLGLFGLAAYTAEQRTKEIGIRKVLGATVTSMIFMLTNEFVKWVLLANLIAWPVAYYFMNRWLQDFAYKIEISWWMFALAGGIALVIALATVSIQAIKAATANPVESLRYE